jgi:hypothetical protein
MPREKGASGSNHEAESTDAPERGGLPSSSDEGPVMGLERRGWVIAADLGQLPFVQWKAAAFARWHEPVMREYPVRICERLGVQFPGPTRHSRRFASLSMNSSRPHRRHVNP